MSILGRVGALLKSELSGRWHVRRWGGRRDARPDQQRTAGDTDARPEATEGRGPRVPVQDPVQDPVLVTEGHALDAVKTHESLFSDLAVRVIRPVNFHLFYSILASVRATTIDY